MIFIHRIITFIRIHAIQFWLCIRQLTTKIENFPSTQHEILYYLWTLYTGEILSSNGPKFGVSQIENVAIFHIGGMLVLCPFIFDVVECAAWRFVHHFAHNFILCLPPLILNWFPREVIDRTILPNSLDTCIYLWRWSILKTIIQNSLQASSYGIHRPIFTSLQWLTWIAPYGKCGGFFFVRICWCCVIKCIRDH